MSVVMRMVGQFHRVSTGLWFFLISVTMVICALSLMGFLGRLWWVLELASNFRVQYAVCLGVAVVVLVVGKKWPWAVVSSVFLIANMLEVSPAFIGSGGKGEASQEKVRVLLANVLGSNRQYERFLELIRSVGPDIIVVLEANEGWMGALSPLEEEYPHVIGRPRRDVFGMALFSRLPIGEWRVLETGESDLPTIVAGVQVRDREFTIVATHPAPPINAGYARRRNRQLEAVAKHIQTIEGPVVFVGDFNTSPWSPHFKRLLRRTGLRDSRRGRGIQASWPVQLPLFRIPIDHCLHSAEIVILRRWLGARIGSDHFPVVVDFSFREG